MDINKHIVDQRIRKIVADNPDKFTGENDDRKKLSKVFVCLSVASCLDIELEEAFGLITEGGNDAGIDAIYIGDVNEYDFPVTLFQGKYTFDLNRDTNFPANAIQRVIGAIGAIFDPSKPLEMNEDLMPKVEDIRSLIADGYIPNIKCVFTNNGLKWQQEGDNHIVNAGFPESQVRFEYYNHKNIVDSLLKDLELTFDKLTHTEFEKAKTYFETNRNNLFERANEELLAALNSLYPAPKDYKTIDKKRLSATFRRGDLMAYL
jgi:hypothetical protein